MFYGLIERLSLPSRPISVVLRISSTLLLMLLVLSLEHLSASSSSHKLPLSALKIDALPEIGVEKPRCYSNHPKVAAAGGKASEMPRKRNSYIRKRGFYSSGHEAVIHINV